MKYETAGDPINGLKWTRKTTEKIADALRKAGIDVSRNTVARLLKQMNYRLRVNHKKRSTASPKDRDKQFRYINRQRNRFVQSGDPVISIDSKKKELVGDFKNAGDVWAGTPRVTLDHDFRSEAKGIAIPFGIYDHEANRGFVAVGTSRETAEFAVDSVVMYWTREGRRRYPHAKRLLILADGGGGNRPGSRVWKARLQSKLCDPYDLTVTVCHYPPGTSKWNPIEHRLFSRISANWKGEPLESYERILKFIRTTKTKTGLRVRAMLLRRDYEKGVAVSEDEMKTVRVRKHKTLPKWNYTIRPPRKSK
jgi:hypothetical protein